MASKLYNSREHIFTTLGVATNVVLKAGSGEQFQVQGTLNVVDGPDNPANILLNGYEIGTFNTLSGLADVDLDTPLVNGDILNWDSGLEKWTNTKDIIVDSVNEVEINGSADNDTIRIGPYSTEYTAASFITAIGAEALNSLGPNAYNVALGTLAGNLMVGDNLTLLGYRVGRTANTGNNIILIGNSDDCRCSGTDSDYFRVQGSGALSKPIFETINIENNAIMVTTIGGKCALNAKLFKYDDYVISFTRDMVFNQTLATTSNVTFAHVNGLTLKGSDALSNILLGQEAGINIVNAAYNVMIGDYSGSGITNQLKNVMIGTFSGNGHSGNNLTFIGDRVGQTLSSSGDNIILIGTDNTCNNNGNSNYFKLKGASPGPAIFESTNINNSSIMVTTIGGKIITNITDLKYNDFSISFTTQLKFDQALTTTSTPRFNDLGLYDLSLSNPLYINCNEVLSNSRTINLKCLDVDRDLTLGANLTVNTNYISYGTQYLSFTGNSIAFGTSTNYGSGRFVFVSPNTLTVGANYIGIGSQYLNFTGDSITFGTSNSIFGSGKLRYISPSTLTLAASSFINQNLGTTSTPLFQDLNLKRNDTSAATIRITNNNNNFWDIQNNNNNTFTIDYNDSYYLSVNTQGQVTRPNQSCFNTYMSASTNDVTGDGTTFKVQFNTAPTNINSNFNTGTYQYNTPVAGVYTFSASVKLSGMTSSHTLGYCEIICGGNSYRFSQLNPYACQDSSGSLVLNGSTGPVNLSAGVGVYVTVYVYGGTKTVDVISDGGTYLTSFFNGTLIG